MDGRGYTKLPSEVENYFEALNDNSETKWHYHHRDETDKGYRADETKG